MAFLTSVQDFFVSNSQSKTFNDNDNDDAFI